MPTALCVVIITKNEAQNIARCIESVRAVADEIIVMDAFSSDETLEIAENLGAKIHQRAFDDYAQQKNAANALSSFDFILSIDADEELSAGLIREILEEKNKNFPHKAYSLPRLTQYCGRFIRHAGWYPDRAIRLWNKQEGAWVGALHEKVLFIQAISPKNLVHPLLHYAFPNLGIHISKANHYSSLAAQSLYEKGKRVHWSYAFVNASFTFWKKYLLQLGFLDGYPGFLVCYFSALSNFLKYNKLYFLARQAKK